MEMPPVKETADKLFFRSALSCKTASYTQPVFLESQQLLKKMQSHMKNVIDPIFDKIASNRDNYGVLGKTSIPVLKSKIFTFYEKLSNLRLHNLHLQPTYDGSILFKFDDDGINYYLEYFVEHKNEGVDESVLTGIHETDVIIDFSGPIREAFQIITIKTNKFIDNHHTTSINASLLPRNTITETELSYYR